jgi:N-acetylglucosaminyldiphosphoundecaprenol N-acetyl-beta-D-mannosaminyltransferase
MRFNLLDVEFTNIEALLENFEPGDHKSAVFHFAAVSTVLAAKENSEFLKVINSGIIICDSKPLAVLIRFRHHVKIHMRGIDFLRREFLEPKLGPKYFIIGSSAEVLKLASEKIKADSQKSEILGVFAPSYSESIFELENQVKAAIGDLSPDCILICIGSPKQDLLAYQLSKSYQSRIVAIGAALNFYSGILSEAPIIFQKTGTEWLFRLISEPQRLWRRYLIGNTKFIFILLKSWLGK